MFWMVLLRNVIFEVPKMQLSTQSGHPIAYLSKALGPKSQGLSTYEKEYLAILTAVDHWRHYLQLKEFHIYTDNRNLAQLDEQHLHTT
jgi:hypothetical protein